jgi:hypothetical protein
MFLPSHERSARASVMLAAAINSVGMLVEMLGGRRAPSVPEWPAVASASVGVVVLLASWRLRNASVRQSSVLFLVNSLAVVGALWVRDRAYADTGLPWVPYQANKLGCLIVAFLAPGRRVGVLAILAHAGSSVVSLFLLAPEDRARIELGEPTATVAFGGTALALLLHRLNAQELTEQLARAYAEQVSLGRLTRSMAAVRDLANTPVQTIVLCTEMLRPLAGPGTKPVFDRMDRALERLREINELTARFISVRDAPFDGPVALNGEDLAARR